MASSQRMERCPGMSNEDLERILETLRATAQLDSHWYEI